MTVRNPAYRRYLRRMAVAAVLYVATIFVAVKVLHRNTAVSPPTVVLALLPGLAGCQAENTAPFVAVPGGESAGHPRTTQVPSWL